MVRLHLLAATLLLLLASCTDQPGSSGGAKAEIAALRSDPASAKILADEFEAAAFVEAGPGGARRRNLTRAQTPVFVAFGPSSAATAQVEMPIVELAVNSLRSGAFVDIAMTTEDPIGLAEAGKTRTGFQVFFSNAQAIDELTRAVAAGPLQDGAGFKAIMDQAGCGVLVFRDAGWTVYMIVVSTELPNFRQSYCVHREISANLGLAGFLDRSDSILSRTNAYPRFSGSDLILMRMLYDPRLKPGMTAAQARPLLPAVAADALAR